MEFVKNLIEFFVLNWDKISIGILALISFAEVIVRLTPTQSDDSFVERVGGIIRKILDFIKFPNVKK